MNGAIRIPFVDVPTPSNTPEPENSMNVTATPSLEIVQNQTAKISGELTLVSNTLRGEGPGLGSQSPTSSAPPGSEESPGSGTTQHPLAFTRPENATYTFSFPLAKEENCQKAGEHALTGLNPGFVLKGTRCEGGLVAIELLGPARTGWKSGPKSGWKSEPIRTNFDEAMRVLGAFRNTPLMRRPRGGRTTAVVASPSGGGKQGGKTTLTVDGGGDQEGGGNLVTPPSKPKGTCPWELDDRQSCQVGCYHGEKYGNSRVFHSVSEFLSAFISIISIS